VLAAALRAAALLAALRVIIESSLQQVRRRDE
jgi:hypothetical protein